MIKNHTVLAATILCLALSATYAATQKLSFKQYVEHVKKEALAAGISQKTIDTTFVHLKAPVKHTLANVKQLKTQSHPVSFKTFLNNLTPPQTIRKGQKKYNQHYNVLMRIQKKYKVSAKIVIALWGTETNFGEDTGHSYMVPSLITLSYQSFRNTFYHDQLMGALKILNRPHTIPEQYISTWDGGMGQPSFEPTLYLQYAVDFDQDGFPNIWTSVPDVTASIANFLHQNHWRYKAPSSIEVILPKDFSKKFINKKVKYSVQKWASMGIRTKNKKLLPNLLKQQARIVLADDTQHPRAFLAFHNFEVLLGWNRSTHEALAVGLFAKALHKK